MSKKTTYIHAENNNKILSSNEVRLYVPPEPEKMKVLIWGKELCNMAEWNDFLKCVEEKTEENKQLKQQLEEKDKELLEFKRNKLYFELLITRLQWLHKKADEYKEEKERFGMDEEISLSSVWDVLSLQKNNICEYEEMCELQEGIECIANSQLLKDIEHDLQVKATRNENEIFKDIELINQQIKELNGRTNK